MVVDVKHGLLGDGRTRADGVRMRVVRDTGGWYVVRDASSWGDARVLYRDSQDLAVLRWAGAILRIPFHAGQGAFRWEDRTYRIDSMIEGEIRIREGDRLAVRGHVTVTGVHLDSVATELLPIIRPLAWALALRSEAVAKMGLVKGGPPLDGGAPIH